MTEPTTSRPFGAHAPKPSIAVFLLTALRRSGLSRGKIRKMAGAVWRKLGYEIVDASIGGICWRLHIARNVTDNKLLTTSKQYDGAEISELHRAIAKQGGAFIDVGANTGYYSLTLAKLGCKQVVAIEPNPPTLAALTFNARQNPWQDNIAIFPVCIGTSEKVAFYGAGDMGGASVFAENKQAVSATVDSMPLLDIVRQANVSRIGGMKLDIEGYEDRALAPFFDAAPPALYPRVLVMEICNRHRWQQDIIARLKTLGYAPTRHNLRGNLILV